MRSKIWSKIILLVCLCLVPEYSVFCINFEEDNDRFGVDPIETEDRFGYFGDLMPPNFADFLSPLRRDNDDDFEDIDRYGKGKADNDNEEDFRSYIGNVYNPNPKAKNIFDVLNADSDIDDVPIRSSNEQSLDDMDYDDNDDDDEDDEGDRDKVKHPSMDLIRRISPSWDKSNESDRDDGRIIGKSASMKDSISRLIGLGHKSSTASPDEADGESKKDGDSNDDDDDDDDDDSDESNQKTTKVDGKSKGNIFSKLFSKSKKTSSDMDHKATTEASKLTTEKSSASNQTASSEEDDDDDDEDESGDNSTSSSRTSTIKKSSESGSTIVTPLSSSTTDSTSTTSTTKKGKSHKHEEPSSTSSTSAPDNISSTKKVTKKHHKSHTSTITMPSTTLAYKPSETSPKNTKDKEGSEDGENKSDHKSSLEIIEAFLAGLGHESHHTKDNHNSTETPATKSPKHSKTHKKKHGKKHKKTTTLVPESMSTALEETGSNSSSTTAKPENKSTTSTEVSSTIRPKGDTTTATPTSTTDSGASFPVISITRTTSNERPTSDSSTAESNANSNSQVSSTTPIPTLAPYVEDSDDILVTNESIVYSDWNPDVFP